MPPSPQASIAVPSPVSALAFGHSGSLYVGSDDGSLRVYELPSTRVARAVRSLGHEVSSIVCSKGRNGDKLGTVWVASGTRALLFDFASPKLVLSPEDAISVLELGEDAEDVLNELDCNKNEQYLAFSTDAGTVGVVHLPTKQISRMRNRHNSICGSVTFIPDRPSELVSGGYDSALLHHDFTQGGLLSRYDITAGPSTSGVSLAPPFVLSCCITPNALFAASTADGRVWIGGGGEKLPSGSAKTTKKRTRKWEGLSAEDSLWIQVAEGPVVAIEFSDAQTIITCTLLGTLTAYAVSRSKDNKLQFEEQWSTNVHKITKVNAMAIQDRWLTVGGFGEDAKGIVEIWSMYED